MAAVSAAFFLRVFRTRFSMPDFAASFFLRIVFLRGRFTAMARRSCIGMPTTLHSTCLG
jgi:hypothetical protein